MLPARRSLRLYRSPSTRGTCREICFHHHRNGRSAARWHPGPCRSHPMRERRLSRRLCRPRWRGRRRPAWRHRNNQSSPPRDARHRRTRQHSDKGNCTGLRFRERSEGLPLTVVNPARGRPGRLLMRGRHSPAGSPGSPRLRRIGGHGRAALASMCRSDHMRAPRCAKASHSQTVIASSIVGSVSLNDRRGDAQFR
jgi:hypothetical protein